ncbi:MAG: HD domain-containing protein [Candidatus Saccharimonadales bacterium]
MDRLAELQRLIGTFAGILRVPKLAQQDRQENDVEHSFGLALTCWFLAPKIAPHLNLEKILIYALAHDIVEVHSGDTFAFDAEAVSQKADSEDQALRRLCSDWPDFSELTDAAAGYKEKRDAEARFVYTIDKLLPSIMTKLDDDTKFWREHKVTREMHEVEKNAKMRHSPEAFLYLDLLNAWMAEPDHFYKPERG